MSRESFDRFWDGVDLADLRFAQSAFTDRASFDRFWDGVDLRELAFVQSGFNQRRTR